MWKVVSCIIMSLILTACASAPAPHAFSPMKLIDSTQANYAGKKQYRLGAVNVNLNEVKANPDFPNQEQLSQIFSKIIRENLQKNNLLNDSPDNPLRVDMTINYDRSFMGGGFGMNRRFAHAQLTYSRKVFLADKEIASDNSDVLHSSEGAWDVLVNFATMFSSTSNPEKEAGYFPAIGAELANLPR